MSDIIFSEPDVIPRRELNRLRRQGVEVVIVNDVTKVAAFPAPAAITFDASDIEPDGFKLGQH